MKISSEYSGLYFLDCVIPREQHSREISTIKISSCPPAVMTLNCSRWENQATFVDLVKQDECCQTKQ